MGRRRDGVGVGVEDSAGGGSRGSNTWVHGYMVHGGTGNRFGGVGCGGSEISNAQKPPLSLLDVKHSVPALLHITGSTV